MKLWQSQVIKNKKELASVVQKIVAYIKNSSHPQNLLLLKGPLGVGKTEFVRMLAEELSLKDVASPSFAIHHRYENDQGVSVDHVDLYRLKNEEDLESTGFWDLFAQPRGIVAIEWSDRLNSDFLPLQWNKIFVHMSFYGQKNSSNPSDIRKIEIYTC